MTCILRNTISYFKSYRIKVIKMCLKIILFVVVCFELNLQQHNLFCDAYQYWYLLNNGAGWTYARQDGYDNNNKELNIGQFSNEGRGDGLETYGFRYPSADRKHDYGRNPYPSGYPGSPFNDQNLPRFPENRGNNPCCTDTTRFTQTPGGPNNVDPISGQLDNSFDGKQNPSSNTPNILTNNPGNQFNTQYGASPYPNSFNPPCVCNNSASYSFTFDSDNFKRQESSDRRGNVIGYLQYRNGEGLHDLSYIANDRSGFKITGGNLAASFSGYLPPPPSVRAPPSWSMTLTTPRGEIGRPDDGLRERETSQKYGEGKEVAFFVGSTSTESEQVGVK